jgi:hypothetical protein
MSRVLRIASAEAVVPGVLKIVWNDGYQGVVDLRGIIEEGDIFSSLRDPERFREVRVNAYGHSIYWGNEGDEDVDFGCDRLRELAQEQAELIRRAS